VTPLSDLARSMFGAAVTAVQPASLMRRVEFVPAGVSFADFDLVPSGRLVVVALGKAAPGLAAAFLHRSERHPDTVFVLAPEDAPAPERVRDQVRRARHPAPDARGEAATRELLDLLAGLDRSDGVVVLLSGGSSALLGLPLPGVERERAAAVTRALLLAGARIGELNVVRKHLFAALGGRLAAACPARVLTLALSDVPGDDLAVVGSGPTVADPSTCADAAAVLHRFGLAAEFPEIAAFLDAGVESPKPGDPRLSGAAAHLLGGSREALAAAAAAAASAGFAPRVLTREFCGEAWALGDVLGALARTISSGEPVALLAAGETTVSVRGAGIGGRNLEVALAAARALAGIPERCILAAGTDGIDGASPAAGAVVDGDTIGRAVARGRDATLALAENDSWGFFSGLPEAIVTGPSGTNVADLAFILAAGSRADFLAAAATARLTAPTIPVG
jgi:glycerate-2-kinase